MSEAVWLRRLIGDDGRDLVLVTPGRSDDCDVMSSSSSSSAAAAAAAATTTT